MRAALALAAAALAGCASVSERDCRRGDWAALGRADGERGAPASHFERHREACATHGVTPDAQAWRRAHGEALVRYCTPKGGYESGRRGDRYQEVCADGAVEDAFLGAHRRGRDVASRLRELRELKQRADELEIAAMGSDEDDRTRMRLRAADVDRQYQMQRREIERLDRRYSEQFGAEPLSGRELFW